MSDDLIERLNTHQSWRDSHGELNDAPNLAAAEIKRLRAALEKIDDKAKYHSSTLALEVTTIARKALGGNDAK